MYPVIRKWRRGVGISDETRPMRSLFMYPGKRSVFVDAAITVETSELICSTLGLSMCIRSVAMRLSAVLSEVEVAVVEEVRWRWQCCWRR